MTQNKAIERYLRRVSRGMCCSASSKQERLDGLRQELAAQPLAEYDALCDSFGAPAKVAAELMESVSADEVRRVKRGRIAAVVAVVLVLAVIAAVCGTYAYDKYMKYGRPGTTVVVVEEETEW